MRVTVLHNPTAGDEEHGADTICAVIRAAGHEVAYQSVKKEGWKDALEQPADLVAIAGGDGTVQKAMRQLATKRATAALLPLGSANNIARALGIVDAELEPLVAGWSHARIRAYDIGEVSAPGLDACFVESFGGGLFAASVECAKERKSESDDKVLLGLRTLREVVESLPAQRWRLELDGRDCSGDFLAVEAMTVGVTGPGVPLAPGADPGDGFVDVVTIETGDLDGIAAYLDERLDGRDAQLPLLRTERARVLRLWPSEGCPLRVDDDLVSLDADPANEEAVVVTARRYSLDVLVPA